MMTSVYANALRMSALNLRFSAVSLWTNSSSVQSRSQLPDAPKQPPGPMGRFLVQNKESLKEEYPKLRKGEFIREAARRWNNLPEAEKEAYQIAFANDMRDYREKKESFAKNLEKIGKMEEYKTQKAIEKDVKKLKKLERSKRQLEEELQKPKNQIPNPFSLFIKDNFHNDKRYTLAAKKIPILAEKWKSLSPDEKAGYEQRFAKLHKEFADALKKWNEKLTSDEVKKLQDLKSKISQIKQRKKRNEKKQDLSDS